MTKAEQIQGAAEVVKSFEYFCDHHVYIEDKERNCAIKLELWDSQRGCLAELVSALLLMLLKTRQVGLTWLSAALVLWLGITKPLWLTIIISASEDHAIEFLNRVYFILDRLPAYLIPPIKTRTKQCLEFQHKGGLISTIKSMPTIEMGAESKTPNLLIIDEAHTIRNVGTIFNASYPGIEQAKGRVIIIANSVKGGAGWGWARDTYTASMQGKNKFKRIFLPWTAHPGRPADFRARMIENGMDPVDVVEHYPETEAEALAAATGSYFADTLSRHKFTVSGIVGNLITDKKTIRFSSERRGIMELWRYPYHLTHSYDGRRWLRRYAIGSDVAEGLGQDYSVAHVYDRHLDEIVCRVRSNRIDAYQWAEIINNLSKFYDRALVAVEVTGAGQTTVKRLIELKTPQYVVTKPDRLGNGMTKQFGWQETQQAKHELAGDLKAWFRTMTGTLYDAILLDEAATFIRLENGKLDHEDGKDSDCVISAGLALQASHFIGEKAEQVKEPLSGWRKKIAEEREATPWAA